MWCFGPAWRSAPTARPHGRKAELPITRAIASFMLCSMRLCRIWWVMTMQMQPASPSAFMKGLPPAGSRWRDASRRRGVETPRGLKPTFHEHCVEALVARFHSMLHTGCKHGSARLRIRQSHSHGHERAVALRFKRRFDVVVGCGIRQMHALDMNEPAERLHLEALSREIESLSFVICPFESHFAS